ncbi:hypothetical protein HK405_001985 [Cladochytrium tenue]|nr:hypothetical protein HK405_001985 [Cladochytrium tenue]
MFAVKSPASPTMSTSTKKSSVLSFLSLPSDDGSDVYEVRRPSVATDALTRERLAAAHLLPEDAVAPIDVASTGARMHHNLQHSAEELRNSAASIRSRAHDDISFVDPATTGPRHLPVRPLRA